VRSFRSRDRSKPCALIPIAKAIGRGAALAFVPLLLDAGRPAKANLSIDGGLLSAIDEAAKAHGLTRSAFLASAAREKIESEG
jgi:hypothetical protein